MSDCNLQVKQDPDQKKFPIKQVINISKDDLAEGSVIAQAFQGLQDRRLRLL